MDKKTPGIRNGELRTAWKHARAMMWQRWQDFIDFETLKQRHLKMPFEGRPDVLFDAIGMLYGEHLTDHINEYRELEEWGLNY